MSLRNEETYAQQLYLDLQQQFAGKSTLFSRIARSIRKKPRLRKTAIAIEGAGVHWHCTISSATRQCQIHCFDINRLDIPYKGPEFYTYFLEKEKKLATGRTFNKSQTIKAVQAWIGNKTIDNLYFRFSFIDETKRLLEKIRAIIIKSNPEIAHIPVNKVKEEQFFNYSLWIKDRDRACRLYRYGYDSTLRYVFFWDGAKIVETTGADIQRLGGLIKKWVCDKAMPSTLKNEFPEIDFGKLSEYYEAGNSVEGEFIVSWDKIEQFYTDFNKDRADPILVFLQSLREQGHDKVLRAGQSLYTLLLSRSRRHGLRENQRRLTFTFDLRKNALTVVTVSGKRLMFDKIEHNATIERLLRSLSREAID